MTISVAPESVSFGPDHRARPVLPCLYLVSGGREPSANTVLTTVLDARGQSWTPRCPSVSSGLFRWSSVDSRGPRHSPENRKARAPSRRLPASKTALPGYSGGAVLDGQVLLAGQTSISTLAAEAGWTRLASATSAYGRGSGKRLERAVAPPAFVSSSLRCRKARNGAVTQWANGCRGCVVVIAITFICTGSGPVQGRPSRDLGLRPIMPSPVTCICVLTDTTGVRCVTPRVR
jgi:hypothetical protein